MEAVFGRGTSGAPAISSSKTNTYMKTVRASNLNRGAGPICLAMLETVII